VLVDGFDTVSVADGRPVSRAPGKRRPLLLVALGIAVAVGLLQLAYTYSGTGQWEFQEQRKGISVYSMKVPGENMKKFLAVFRIKSTLNQATAFLQDDHSDVGDVGFYDSMVLKQESSLVRWTTWKMRMPRLMSDRQFVVRHAFSQDPKTKEVLYTLDAAPSMIPADKCCVRVSRMANRWRLIPLSNGEVEVRWVIDVDVGGWVPYFSINRHFAWEMVDFGSSLQEIVNRAKYVGARTGWVEELRSGS
jgi:hypothetical protein